MAANDDQEHSEEDRIKRLIDRLAEVLWGLPPDRQQAFREYLDERIKHEEADDDGAPEATNP
jgi:hypothetical protein